MLMPECSGLGSALCDLPEKVRDSPVSRHVPAVHGGCEQHEG
jgi:hypothetical protein